MAALPARPLLSPLHRAMRQIGLHLEHEMSGLDVPSDQCHMLSYLRSYAPCRIGELSRVFGIKPSTLTSMVDRLESAGVLRRTQDPADGRAFLMDLTPKGTRTADEINKRVGRFERSILDSVAPRDLAGMHAVLAAVAAKAQVEVRPESHPHNRTRPRP